MARISLQPAAGAHGEWTGLRMIQAYHAAHEDTHRTRVLIPTPAHGQNPASQRWRASRMGPSGATADGTVDVADIARHLDSSVAAIMMTNPNTSVSSRRTSWRSPASLTRRGALLYYDGANLNALVGLARPVTWASTSSTSTCHKTFSTPSRRGGPGRPGRVAEALAAFLPTPTVERDGDRFLLDHDRTSVHRQSAVLTYATR